MAGGAHKHLVWHPWCHHMLSGIYIGTRHRGVEVLSDFLFQLIWGYSSVLKNERPSLFLKSKALGILTILPGNSTYLDLQLSAKINKFLSSLSSGKAFVITKEEKTGGKLRRSAGGEHNASFELRGWDSCSINTLLFIFSECVWDGEFKGLYSAQLSLAKHIFQDLHASPNVTVHFTRLEYIISVVVSVTAKISWMQDTVWFCSKADTRSVWIS